MNLLTILILSIYKCRCFHLFASPLISLMCFIVFSVQIFNLPAQVSSYFLLFSAIKNKMFFLISSLPSSFLGYRNASDFFMLILYLANVLDLFRSNSFLGGVFNIQDYVICKQMTILLLIQFAVKCSTSKP